MSLPNAILSSPGLRRGLVLSVLILLATGCGDTSQSPENPTIIGVPPDTAYLGVDYSYNFGSAGGDQLLNYSLSNNPSWLALEKTTNNARPGIVLRGQPGISGGREGEAHLGTNEGIRITTNDGSLLGDSEFEIEVLHNALEIIREPITEGSALTPDVDKDEEAVCEIPDMSVRREVEVRHRNLLTGSEAGFSQDSNDPATRTYRTYPALIRVDLNKPSVERVSVRFRVAHDDPRASVGPRGNSCSDPANGDQPCEYAGGNRRKAIFGEDLLLNGNADRYKSDRPFPEPPDYIEFLEETEDGGTGVLTFEAGQTSCFIPVWVHEDDLAESTERFNVDLLEVTEGLASLRQDGANSNERILIEDTTPSASVKKDNVVITRGEERKLKAELSIGNNTGEVLRAGLQWLTDGDEVAENVEACFPTAEAADCTDTPPLVVEFEPGAKEAEFFVKAKGDDEGGPAPEDLEPLARDKEFTLGFSDDFQFGREFAAIASDDTTDVTINEWNTDVVTAFDLDTLVAGGVGEVYVAGTASDGSLVLRSINRLGETAFNAERDVVNLSNGASLPAPSGSVELAFDGRDTNTSSSPEMTRYLGLGYSSGEGESIQGELALFRSVISQIRLEDDSKELQRSTDDLQWQYQTSGDELGVFQLAGIAISGEGDFSVAATGAGSDPIRMIQVDNNTGDESPQPELRWTQSETTGGNNNLVGVVTNGAAGFNAVGSTLGTVEPDQAVGMEDFFFFGVQDDGAAGNRQQFGTNETDRLSAFTPGGTRAWLGGDGGVRYELDDFRSINDESPLEAGNAFVFATSRTGDVLGVRNFAGSDNEPVPASVDAMAASNDSVIVAGASQQGGAPYLMSLSYNSRVGTDEERIQLDWRLEVEGAAEIIGVSFFDERKVFLAFRNSSGESVIRPYDLHGNRLSQAQ